MPDYLFRRLRPYCLAACILFARYGFSQQELSTRSENVVVADSAYSIRQRPTRTPEYYVEQGVKYFLTMESSVPPKIRPNYSKLVIRWEWHPWLLLTGYGRRNMIQIDIMLKWYPTKYDTIDCRYFDRQPFCRCHVIFNYSEKHVPIYEEFTFNDQGEITFIEAWSDYPSLLPMKKEDYWAEGPNVNRLSTRVPGLGNKEGRIHIKAPWMIEAARSDSDLADLLHRLKHPITTYFREIHKQKSAMIQAIHPPPGDQFPYR